MNKFNIESTKQFKINLTLTLLVIILTVVNLVVASLSYVSDRNDNRIFEVYSMLTSIEERVYDDTLPQLVNELKKDVIEGKELNNIAVKELRNELEILEIAIMEGQTANEDSINKINELLTLLVTE